MHPGAVLGGSGLQPGTALAHHKHPQRAMRQLGGDVDVALALHILENPMLNGETIRLDGALRMAPR